MPAPNKYDIANPCDAEIYAPGRVKPYRGGTSLFRMWLGPYGTTVYVWADGFESAFETLVEWADDNAPGFLVSLDVDDLKSAAEDLGVEWQSHWPDWDDEDFSKVVEHAEIDLTVIGHTTLTHGQYIPSHEWGGSDVTDSDEYEEIRRESLELCDSE